jgi:hypothetical protein
MSVLFMAMIVAVVMAVVMGVRVADRPIRGM